MEEKTEPFQGWFKLGFLEEIELEEKKRDSFENPAKSFIIPLFISRNIHLFQKIFT